MHIGKYIDLVHRAEEDLVKAFKLIANAHGDEVDVYQTCMLLSSWSETLANDIEVFANRYNKERDNEPDRLSKTLMKNPRKGAIALLRDLHDVYLMVTEVQICCVLLKQGATGLHDKELLAICEEVERQTKRQQSWLMTRMKSAAPQTLIVPE